MNFYKAFKEDRQEITNDILELIESHYEPRVAIDQKRIKSLKLEVEKIDTEIKSLEDKDSKLKQDASDEEK